MLLSNLLWTLLEASNQELVYISKNKRKFISLNIKYLLFGLISLLFLASMFLRIDSRQQWLFGYDTFWPRCSRDVRAGGVSSASTASECTTLLCHSSVCNLALERTAYAVLPSASCRGHQRMQHLRRRNWRGATRTTRM